MCKGASINPVRGQETNFDTEGREGWVKTKKVFLLTTPNQRFLGHPCENILTPPAHTPYSQSQQRENTLPTQNFHGCLTLLRGIAL